MDIVIKALGFVVYLLAVPVMAVAAVSLIGKQKQKKRCLGKVNGMISHIHEVTQVNGQTKTKVYTPEFTYQVNDRTYTQKAPFTSTKKEFQVGQEVVIHYDPKDPYIYYVDKEMKISARGGMIFLVIGLALIFLGNMLVFF